jgi:hypothetical protein
VLESVHCFLKATDFSLPDQCIFDHGWSGWEGFKQSGWLVFVVTSWFDRSNSEQGILIVENV